MQLMLKKLFYFKKSLLDDIIIVSGLPRSGTSMMMRMLEAGGLDVVVDNIRKPDEDNPNGYYEFEQIKKIKANASFLDHIHGKGVKMVSTLLCDLPKNKKYKIIFMQRNLHEMLMSQKIMLQRNGKMIQDDDQSMRRIFEKHLREVTSWLSQQSHIDVIYIDYNDVIKNPLARAETVSEFLRKHLDIEKMASVVDHTLYRRRMSQGLVH